MKRTIDLLTLLPKDIRDLAIQRHKEYLEAEGRNINNSLSNSLYDAVDLGIYWRGTPEGYDFWHEIHSKIQQKELKILSSKLIDKI